MKQKGNDEVPSLSWNDFSNKYGYWNTPLRKAEHPELKIRRIGQCRGENDKLLNHELAFIKVLHDMGESKSAIGRRLGYPHRGDKMIAHHLLNKRMESPEVIKLVEEIKKTEIKDLTLIGVKARIRLHEQLDAGETKPIENVAIMDRSFQQRRLLEGSATEIFDMRQYKALEAEIQETARKIIELKKQKDYTTEGDSTEETPSDEAAQT